ncbi:MAG TPA: hypothetical protein VEH27_11795 [Methylomirabilota bacterium]|nr:hypothetical protein [Methylomirabilota bacterium]
MATVHDVAIWMKERIESAGVLYQDEAVAEIQSRFDCESSEFLRINQSGNWSIAPNVLTIFRKMTENTVVWDRYERMWRLREDSDLPGKRGCV